MKNNVPIVIYRNWLAAFTSLPSEAVGDIMKALAVHVMTGETPVLPQNLEIIKNQLITEVDEGLTKYFAKCEKNKRIADEREAKKAKEEHERETDVSRTCGNSKTKTKTKTKTNNSSGEELEVGANKSPTPERKKIPPTIEMVRKYCQERNSCIDPDYFFNYFEGQGWVKANGQKVKDWQATLRTWENGDKGKGNTQITAFIPQQPAIEPINDYLERKRREAQNGNNDIY